MSAHGGPDEVTSGLVLALDAADIKSYPRTGTVWYDRSGNGYNGTLVNGVGYSNGGMVFDGVDDYISLGTSANLKFTTNFTVALWIKFNSLNGIQTIISNNETGGYGIIANLNGTRLETWYYISGNYYKAGEEMVNYNTSSWFNVVATYDNSNIRFYRNGNLIQTVPITGSVTTTSEPLIVGSNPRSGGTLFSDYLNGLISVVQIYNRALTQEEVLQNYNANKSRFGL